MIAAGWISFNFNDIVSGIQKQPKECTPKPVSSTRKSKGAAASAKKDCYVTKPTASNTLWNGVGALISLVFSPILLAGQIARELTSPKTPPIRRMEMIQRANVACAGLLAQIVNNPEDDHSIRMLALQKMKSFGYKFASLTKPDARECIRAQIAYIHELKDNGAPNDILVREIQFLNKNMINIYQIHRKGSPAFTKDELTKLLASLPAIEGGHVKVTHYPGGKAHYIEWFKDEPKRPVTSGWTVRTVEREPSKPRRFRDIFKLRLPAWHHTLLGRPGK